MGVAQDPIATTASQANREEFDARSIFSSKAIDGLWLLTNNFQACGTVHRVTIRPNRYAQQKRICVR